MSEKDDALQKKKTHREPLAGRKAKKKKDKNPHVQELTAKQKNPKAFTFHSVVSAERRFRRKQDVDTKRYHIPLVDRTPLLPPPIIVVVVGPPKVGKTTLMQCLIKSFTRQPLTNLKGPITLVSGKKRRITLIECNNDINSMIDLAKIADLVLLLVDASFGFEMEIFEFLNVCQVHGMPRVMGVLTHLDMFKNSRQLKKTKKILKHRFWTEVYAGAKLFYLSGLLHDEYLRNEVKNLGRFISVMKFRPLAWRTSHPYILADRLEDLTPPELVRQNPKVDRMVSLYGYVRGISLNKMNGIHIPGCGDLRIHDVSHLPDPCPLPDKLKKRVLVEKERLVYAPFAGVGGIVYDKDAVYVELGGSHSHREKKMEPEQELVKSILNTQETLDMKMARSELQLFSGAPSILSADVKEKSNGLTEKLVDDSGRMRRKVVFADEESEEGKVKEEDSDEDEGSDDESEEDEEEDVESDSETESQGMSKMKPKRDHSLNETETESVKKKKIVNVVVSGGERSQTDRKKGPPVEVESDQQDVTEVNQVHKKKKKKGKSGDDEDNNEEENRCESSSQSVNKKKSKRDHGLDGNEAEAVKELKATGVKVSGSQSSRTDKKISPVKDGSDKKDGNEERKEHKNKKPKSAIALAESRLLNIMAEDSDGYDEDEDETDDEEWHRSEIEDVPRRKRKLTEENEAEEQQAKRYHGIGNEEDRAIHSKVSSLLSQLETNNEKKKSAIESETSSREFTLEQFSSDEDSSEEEDNSLSLKPEDADSRNPTGGDDDDDDDEDAEMETDDSDKNNSGQEDSAVRWKSNLAQKAADAFMERQATTQNLWKLVYGDMKHKQFEDNDGDSDGDDVGGLFRVVKKKQQYKQEQKDLMNAEDCSKFIVKQVRDWMDSSVCEIIRDCFVTGKWKESEDAEELLRLDDESDGELFGDFEDLETGEKHISKTEEKDKVSENEDGEEEGNKKTKDMTREEIQEKKRKLKAKFDAEYDDKDGGKTYYDELKEEMDHQAQLNKNEFEGLDDNIRVQLEGYRPGLYVRVEVANVPCELITNFDPTYPLIVGGLQSGEENIGFVQVRIKKHRWHKKILKTQDPLIISLGWRRFQTLPIYSKLEDNFRNRRLKYTPEHVTCMATFWGPVTPQTTGFLAVQDVATRQCNFRIAATGSVVELDKSTQITKKLKLTGTPYKIYKKTAFIKDMFNSTLEVAKFEGAKLKTVSGIRGQIKRAISKPEGSFRATFEDKIMLSDLVFCRTWCQVDVPKFYNPVTSLLLPPEQKNLWRGMKTVGQLKRERGLRNEPSEDSLYKTIVREPKVFKPLVIPKALQKELPYDAKPKHAPKVQNKKAVEAMRIAVIREPHERKVAALLKETKVSFGQKQRQLKEAMHKRMQEHKMKMNEVEMKKLRRQKELRRHVFKTLSKMEEKKNKEKNKR